MLLLFKHRKSNTDFPLVPKLITLNVLERRNGHYSRLLHWIPYSGWIRPILSATKCRSNNL